MLLGLESGEVKVADRVRFCVYTSCKLAEASVLKIEQVLEAVLIQYKDLEGSIFVTKPPTQANRYSLETVLRIKTMSSSFTTFAADTVVSELGTNYILVVTSCPDFPHKPKMQLLSAACDSVIQTKHLEALPSALSHASEVSKFSGKPKKGTKGKKTREEELVDERPLEGSVTCLKFSDGSEVLEEPELFVGYESGSIGLFRLSVNNSNADGTPGDLRQIKMFTAQKLIQDPSVKHILSIGVAHTNSEEELDFTLSIGYYSKIIQTIKFVPGFDTTQYTMVD